MNAMRMEQKPDVKCVRMVLGIMLGTACWGRVIVPQSQIQVEDAEIALTDYRYQTGKFPDSLDVLAREPVNGKFLLEEKDLTDPWGEPIGYAQGGDRFAVWSTGPDKIMGTRDDIVYGHLPLYVESWRALQAESGAWAGTNALQEAMPEKVPSYPKPTVMTEEEQARKEAASTAKQMELIRLNQEMDRAARRLFMRNAAIVGSALILGIVVTAVWARARKKAGRE